MRRNVIDTRRFKQPRKSEFIPGTSVPLDATYCHLDLHRVDAVSTRDGSDTDALLQEFITAPVCQPPQHVQRFVSIALEEDAMFDRPVHVHSGSRRAIESASKDFHTDSIWIQPAAKDVLEGRPPHAMLQSVSPRHVEIIGASIQPNELRLGLNASFALDTPQQFVPLHQISQQTSNIADGSGQALGNRVSPAIPSPLAVDIRVSALAADGLAYPLIESRFDVVDAVATAAHGSSVAPVPSHNRMDTSAARSVLMPGRNCKAGAIARYPVFIGPAEGSDSIRQWGFSSEVLAAVDLVTLYPWQTRCLRIPGIMCLYPPRPAISIAPSLTLSSAIDQSPSGMGSSVAYPASLVYSAPTSAGKSLVATLLMFRRLFDEPSPSHNAGPLAVFAVPTRSLADQKVADFKAMLCRTHLKCRVAAVYGSLPIPPLKERTILVVTFERAHNIMDAIVESRTLISAICTVVIDELHYMGNESRGACLETLLVKIIFLQRQVAGCRLQLIGMSATIPNLRVVAEWLGAQVYEESAFRPVKLEEFLFVAKTRLSAGGIYRIARSSNLVERTSSSSTALGMEVMDFVAHKCLAAHGTGISIIIFAPTRAATQQVCKFLGDQFTLKPGVSAHISSTAVISNRSHLATTLAKQGYPAGNIQAIMQGVACHHAGLTEDARDAIQVAFQNCIVQVIVATSTLAEGLNLPANLVLFTAPRVGQALVSSAQYAQMSGRAGRAGLADSGQSIVCVKDEAEADAFLRSLQEEVMPVQSQIALTHGAVATSTIARLVLDGLVRKYSNRDQHWPALMFNPELSAHVFTDVRHLLADSFVRIRLDGTMHATATGEAVSRSGIDASFAIRAYGDLSAACTSFSCGTMLQMLYICCPVDLVDFDKLAWDDFDTLACMCCRNDTFAQGFMDSVHYSPQLGNLIFCNKATFLKEERVNHSRLFVSCVLYLCLLQIPGFDPRKYGVTDFMTTITAFRNCAGRVATFAECLRWWSVAAAAKKFKRYLQIPARMMDIQRQLGLSLHEVRYFQDHKLRSPGDVVRLGLAGLRCLCRSSLPFHPCMDTGTEGFSARHEAQTSAWHGIQSCSMADSARADKLFDRAVACMQKEIAADAGATDDDETSDSSATTTSSQCSDEFVAAFEWDPVTDAPQGEDRGFAALDRTIWQEDDSDEETRSTPCEGYLHSVPLPSYEKLNLFDTYIAHSQLRADTYSGAMDVLAIDKRCRATAGLIVYDALSSLKTCPAVSIYTHPKVQCSRPSWLTMLGSALQCVFIRLCPHNVDAGPATWQSLVCDFVGVPAVQVVNGSSRSEYAGFAAAPLALVSKIWNIAWQRAWDKQVACALAFVQEIVDISPLVFVNNVVETVSNLYSCGVHLHPLRTLDVRAAAWMLTGSANVNDFAVEDLKRRYWTKDTQEICAADVDFRLLLPAVATEARGVRRSKAGQQAKDALDHSKDIYLCGVAFSILLKQQCLAQPFQQLEMPFLFALATIKRNGLEVDLKTLQSQYESVNARLERVKKRIADLAQVQGWTGVPFNLESGADVRWLLDSINAGRPVERNSRACCSSAFLEKLLTSSNSLLKFVAELVQESSKTFNVFRSLSALRHAALASNNGRLSCEFNTITATGRVIASMPALQGLPKIAVVNKVAIQHLQDELLNRAPLAELMKSPKCQVLLYAASRSFSLHAGRIIRVLHDRTIGDPPAESASADKTPLAVQWNERAACYEQEDYGKIVQTVVDLYSSNAVKRMIVPADKVYRDVAGRSLPEDSTDASAAYAREWRTPLEICPRNAITAAQDCVLVAADYSQIEVRMLAHLSRDPALMTAVKSDNDIFKGIASQVRAELLCLPCTPMPSLST
jgi:replicative superfamily II helicase